MTNLVASSTTPTVVAVGLIGLAAGMGIGRFALTPLLPLMQEHGMSLAQGGWLAAANYAGYLVGALSYAALSAPASRAARFGLLAVAVLTLAMGCTVPPWLALALRFAAGIASAFVLVGVSAWTLTALAERQRSHLAGWVFAGVGVGMAVAGLVSLRASLRSQTAEMAWLVLGMLAVASVVVAWRPLVSTAQDSPSSGAERKAPGLAVNAKALIACYGVFGLGYIIPATFLPALARELVDDASVFGWIWPLFGAAAASSTIVTSLLFGKAKPIRIWAWAHAVMALGVLAPALWPSLTAVTLSALCVGGTFMVITMAGMQTARASTGVDAPRLMSMMTAAFAAGQLLGPLAVSGLAASHDAMRFCSMVAGMLLLGTAAVLLRRRELA